jgi:xylulose-5-phosphate/fructose-6-phosphate phosphoketolase
VINVVDLFALQSPAQHPHGLDDAAFDALFTTDKPVIFAYHGYPTLIHRLTYKRANHGSFHVHGYQEEGSTTTPFDMAVRNRLDRFHLAAAALAQLPGLAEAAYLNQEIRDRLVEHKNHIAAHGIDLPSIRNWQWPQ